MHNKSKLELGRWSAASRCWKPKRNRRLKVNQPLQRRTQTRKPAQTSILRCPWFPISCLLISTSTVGKSLMMNWVLGYENSSNKKMQILVSRSMSATVSLGSWAISKLSQEVTGCPLALPITFRTSLSNSMNLVFVND